MSRAWTYLIVTGLTEVAGGVQARDSLRLVSLILILAGPVWLKPTSRA